MIFIYFFIDGLINFIDKEFIVIENNSIGYLVYVSNSSVFTLNEKKKLYIYQHVRENDILLYGFNTLEEKELFVNLISVKGLGCKTAISILGFSNALEVKNAIYNGDILFLKKFPKIGNKVANQIILDLQNKIDWNSNSSCKIINDEIELVSALKNLGYKNCNINKVIKEININDNLESKIKEALLLLNK